MMGRSYILYKETNVICKGCSKWHKCDGDGWEIGENNKNYESDAYIIDC